MATSYPNHFHQQILDGEIYDYMPVKIPSGGARSGPRFDFGDNLDEFGHKARIKDPAATAHA